MLHVSKLWLICFSLDFLNIPVAFFGTNITSGSELDQKKRFIWQSLFIFIPNPSTKTAHWLMLVDMCVFFLFFFFFDKSFYNCLHSTFFHEQGIYFCLKWRHESLVKLLFLFFYIFFFFSLHIWMMTSVFYKNIII